MAGAETTGRPWTEWLESMRQAVPDGLPGKDSFLAFARLVHDFAEKFPDVAEAERAEAWADLWKAQAEVLGFGLREFTAADFDPGRGAEDWLALLRRLFPAAGLGYGREWQLRLQRIEAALQAWSAADRELQQIHASIFASAWSAFGERAAVSGDAPQATLRELYDLFVDCAEDAYRQRVMQDDYAELYGDAMNKRIALQGETGKYVNALMSLLNLPNRGEIDALHQRLRNHGAVPPAADADVEALQRRVEALEAQVARLADAAAGSQSPAGERRPPAKRKAKSRSRSGARQAAAARRPKPPAQAADQEWDIGNL